MLDITAEGGSEVRILGALQGLKTALRGMEASDLQGLLYPFSAVLWK